MAGPATPPLPPPRSRETQAEAAKNKGTRDGAIDATAAEPRPSTGLWRDASSSPALAVGSVTAKVLSRVLEVEVEVEEDPGTSCGSRQAAVDMMSLVKDTEGNAAAARKQGLVGASQGWGGGGRQRNIQST